VIRSKAKAIKCDTQQRRRSGAERMKLSRQRRRDGFAGVIAVEVRQSEVATLVARGFLADAKRHDRAAIAEGLGRLLDLVLAPKGR